MFVSLASSLTAHAGWRARLELELERREDRTVVSRRKHEGPLVVQRPFHPEGPVCHVYLVHPPGGVVGGDVLELHARAEVGAEALLTTPAATKLYRSDGRAASLSQHLEVRSGACVEWLPQEAIVFDGARAEMTTRVDLEQDARFLGWEIACLGRPASGEAYTRGTLRLAFEVWRGGVPLLVERARLEGGGASLSAPWGLGGRAVTGTLVAVLDDAGAVGALRRICERIDLFTVTRLHGLIVCRYLGDRAERARELFKRAWTVLRPRMTGRAICPPRIWST